MAKNKKVKEVFDPRKYMEMAIAVMNQSIPEPRLDKTTPKVGAVLIKPDGTEETAFRGELRHGDHAEFTLLERKNRSNPLEGSVLFATLEPCAPGARRHPKLGCAERIVNARISKVWVGIEDPDPSVDRKGIQYLINHGVEVEMFDPDLQKLIRDVNSQFIAEAEERAKNVLLVTVPNVLSPLELTQAGAHLDELSVDELENFIDKAKLGVSINSDPFYRVFTQLGVLEEHNGIYWPTGIGYLLFGKRPQIAFPNALIRATFKRTGKGEEIETIEGSLPKQIDKIQSWFEKRIFSQIDRSSAQRQKKYDYPLDVFREATINAVVHRDYGIEGAPIYFEINDDAIIVKSPGLPVAPIKFEQLQRFSAPSLSRNPKIMYALDQLELVEQRGLGFQTIKSLPSKFGMPLPLVTYDEPYVIFTFPRSGESLKTISGSSGLSLLNEEELAGFDYVKLNSSLTRKDYEAHFGFDKKKAERHFKSFVTLGLVERKGSGPGTYYEAIAT